MELYFQDGIVFYYSVPLVESGQLSPSLFHLARWWDWLNWLDGWDPLRLIRFDQIFKVYQIEIPPLGSFTLFGDGNYHHHYFSEELLLSTRIKRVKTRYQLFVKRTARLGNFIDCPPLFFASPIIIRGCSLIWGVFTTPRIDIMGGQTGKLARPSIWAFQKGPLTQEWELPRESRYRAPVSKPSKCHRNKDCMYGARSQNTSTRRWLYSSVLQQSHHMWPLWHKALRREKMGYLSEAENCCGQCQQP